jgi:hypothetical protein
LRFKKGVKTPMVKYCPRIPFPTRDKAGSVAQDEPSAEARKTILKTFG